jgi:alanine racemase
MVSLVEEGLELRRAGVGGPIVVMGTSFEGGWREVVAHDLTPVIGDPADADAFARAAAAARVRPRAHVKVDTGMARLGVRHDTFGAFLDRVAGELEITGICTHLASADDPDPEPTRRQLARFEAALAEARARGIQPEMVHAANSAATARFPEAHYGAVRPGLALYHHVMRLVTAVGQVRTLEPGDAVSYGGLWRAPARARVATLPVGYADGYPRRLPNTAEILIRGRRCPVVGAVCMDMTIVDVTALGDVSPGEEAVLLGAQGDDRITAGELAQKAGLIEYEITCGVSKRVPRAYRT